jgi:hypothetical protein
MKDQEEPGQRYIENYGEQWHICLPGEKQHQIRKQPTQEKQMTKINSLGSFPLFSFFTQQLY